MDLQTLRTLYHFDEWANARLLDAVAALSPERYLRDLGSSFGGVHGTLAHMLGAQIVWFQRWKGESPTSLLNPQEVATVAALTSLWDQHRKDLNACLGALTEDGLKRVVEYRDFKGIARSEPFWQQAQHLVNHTTYHRGQVVTLLRQLGVAVPSTDLIVYYREQSRVD